MFVATEVWRREDLLASNPWSATGAGRSYVFRDVGTATRSIDYDG